MSLRHVTVASYAFPLAKQQRGLHRPRQSLFWLLHHQQRNSEVSSDSQNRARVAASNEAQAVFCLDRTINCNIICRYHLMLSVDWHSGKTDIVSPLSPLSISLQQQPQHHRRISRGCFGLFLSGLREPLCQKTKQDECQPYHQQRTFLRMNKQYWPEWTDDWQ